jgi:hypothetical protein
LPGGRGGQGDVGVRLAKLLKQPAPYKKNAVTPRDQRKTEVPVN